MTNEPVRVPVYWSTLDSFKQHRVRDNAIHATNIREYNVRERSCTNTAGISNVVRQYRTNGSDLRLQG